MITFLKYAAFFTGVFVVFLAIAVYAFFATMGGSSGVIGWYMEYDHNLGQFTAYQTKISFYQGGKEHHALGIWSDHVFYPEGQSTNRDNASARILPNEDLVMDLSKFDPPMPMTVVAVLTERVPGQSHPYPVGRPGEQRPNPPPKGLIKPGMLECDLAALPWQPDVKDDPPINLGNPNDHSAFGTNIDNGWPRTWRYKSNDPKLPELRVLVQKGHVTSVSGGAEDTDAVDYTASIGPDVTIENSAGSRTWTQWFLSLFGGG